MKVYRRLLLKIFCLFFILTYVASLLNQNRLKILNSNYNYKYYNNFNSDEAVSEKRNYLFSTNDYDVIKNIPRNQRYYTQGLFFENSNTLVESGGLYWESAIIKMEYPSLKIISKINLDKKYFAEGIAKCGDKIYQLTWNEKKIMQYSAEKFKKLDNLDMNNKLKSGWGLANLNEQQLLATDGTNNIYVLDCLDNLNVVETIPIMNTNNFPLDRINDLIVVDGLIYANRYLDSKIYKINPQDKKVVKIYDFTPLASMEVDNGTLSRQRLDSGDVLNGIAFDKSRNIFVITGKRWGNYYEVIFK